MGKEDINKNSRCVILSGGEIDDYNFTKQLLAVGDYIICADSGLYHAKEMGIIPHLVVGDFDSYTNSLPDNVACYLVPTEKDETDTILAVQKGLEKGYKYFVLLGSLGGRLDHTMANLQTLSYISAKGAQGEIISKYNRVLFVKNGTVEIQALPEYKISIFTFEKQANGITTSGLQYPLNNAALYGSFPLGVSNEFTKESCRISVSDGSLYIVLSKDHI